MTQHIERTDGYWIGRLSACIAEASTRAEPKHVRQDLRETVAAFIASPVPSEELRKILRGYLK